MAKPKLKNQNQFKVFCEYLDQYPSFVLYDHSYIKAKSMNILRKTLQGTAKIMVFKKSLIIRGLKIACQNRTSESCFKIQKLKTNTFQRFKTYNPKRLELYNMQVNKQAIEKYKQIIPILKDSNCIIFCKTDPFAIIKEIQKYKSRLKAKTGFISTTDVWLQAEYNTVPPTRASLFQVLNIPYKIYRGTIQVLERTKVLAKGQIVTKSCEILLDLLCIFPFENSMKIKWIYLNGWVLNGKMMQYDNKYLLNKFENGLKNIQALSVQTGIPTQMSVANMLLRAYSNLLVIAYQTKYRISSGQILLDNLHRLKGLLRVQELEKQEEEQVFSNISYDEIQELPYSLAELDF